MAQDFSALVESGSLMDFTSWLAFVPATFLISVTPGPNMLLMLALGLRLSWRQMLPAMLGAITVVLLMLIASSLGVAVLLIQAPRLFLALKIAGALYLAWLGLQLIYQKPQNKHHLKSGDSQTQLNVSKNSNPNPRQHPTPSQSETTDLHNDTGQQPDADSPRSLFWRGVAVASSNPKAMVFAAAYFPQFIRTDHAVWTQLAILLPTFAVIEVSCFLLYAKSGKQLTDWFAKPRVLRNFNRGIGLVFIAFGLAMVLT